MPAATLDEGSPPLAAGAAAAGDGTTGGVQGADLVSQVEDLWVGSEDELAGSEEEGGSSGGGMGTAADDGDDDLAAGLVSDGGGMR